MKKATSYQICLFVCIPLIITGSALKIGHSSQSNIFLIPGGVLALAVQILGIIDISFNTKLKWYERTMWVSSFVFLQPLSGLLYLPIYKLNNKECR